MSSRRVLYLLILLGVIAGVGLEAQEPVREAVPNWPAPPSWSPGRSDSGGSGLTDVTSPLPFIGITPCRIADTRGLGFTGQAGPPSLTANVTRNFQITGVVPGVPAQCGIPAGAGAVSFNFAVTNITANGNLIAFPAGGTPPTVSSLNWQTGFAALSNAAVVPVSGGGGLGVQVNAAGGTTVDLIIDVNGYYAGAGTIAPSNTFLGRAAGNSTMTGNGNTAIGVNALNGNTTGNANTAVGALALFLNTTGFFNVAIGVDALVNNTTGSSNTAVGPLALKDNTTGNANTAVGVSALEFNTGGSNTAVGVSALGNSTGSGNVAIGAGAGSFLTTGSNNICVGNGGAVSESGTIRIGFVQTRAFIAGVRDVTTGIGNAIPVLIDSNGQLGTVSSSARAKEQIRDMGEVSSALLKLRPVTFHYKGQSQASNPLHFGLIAEEVEEVLPELVVHRPTGEAETVLYHEMPAMLLNELQKQQRRIEQQEGLIRTQDGLIRSLEARLAALEGALHVPAEER